MLDKLSVAFLIRLHIYKNFASVRILIKIYHYNIY